MMQEGNGEQLNASPARQRRDVMTREELLEQLYRRYRNGPAVGWTGDSLRFRLRRFLWIAVIGGAKLLKRTIDILGSSVLLLALSPLFLFVAAAVKLTDFGPVIYWQRRVGRWGREFDMPKFRSMVVNADAVKAKLESDGGEAVRFKMKRDPRITWIGRIIRKLSIDELPQLWNVLKGELSLVGPRPPIPSEVAQYTVAQRRRLDVVPGLTCIWQVSGRSDIPFEDQVNLDVDYIESHGFWLDVKLLLRTIPAVLTGRGAY